MSGTSLDGVDAALVAFDCAHPAGELIDQYYLGYSESLRLRLLALHDSGFDELHRAATIANELSDYYANASNLLIERIGLRPLAIACHGQTIRHRPECGYSIQLVNAARLAERTHLTVIADFRNRDIAAGGQGAPLVPAFHAAAFGHPGQDRAIVNIGGIANLTIIPAQGPVFGFDCGPGNLLLDAWCMRHTGQPYDAGGAWGASGKLVPDLLAQFLRHPYFNQETPKSAGREQFSLAWLDNQLLRTEAAADVQATLVQFTAISIANAIKQHCNAATEIYVCGGGAHNDSLFSALCANLPDSSIKLTDEIGIKADWVEAHAFAWLGWQTLQNLPGNCVEATGATHACVLGAVYPA